MPLPSPSTFIVPRSNGNKSECLNSPSPSMYLPQQRSWPSPPSLPFSFSAPGKTPAVRRPTSPYISSGIPRSKPFAAASSSSNSLPSLSWSNSYSSQSTSPSPSYQSLLADNALRQIVVAVGNEMDRDEGTTPSANATTDENGCNHDSGNDYINRGHSTVASISSGRRGTHPRAYSGSSLKYSSTFSAEVDDQPCELKESYRDVVTGNENENGGDNSVPSQSSHFEQSDNVQEARWYALQSEPSYQIARERRIQKECKAQCEKDNYHEEKVQQDSNPFIERSAGAEYTNLYGNSKLMPITNPVPMDAIPVGASRVTPSAKRMAVTGGKSDKAEPIAPGQTRKLYRQCRKAVKKLFSNSSKQHSNANSRPHYHNKNNGPQVTNDDDSEDADYVGMANGDYLETSAKPWIVRVIRRQQNRAEHRRRIEAGEIGVIYSVYGARLLPPVAHVLQDNNGEGQQNVSGRNDPEEEAANEKYWKGEKLDGEYEENDIDSNLARGNFWLM